MELDWPCLDDFHQLVSHQQVQATRESLLALEIPNAVNIKVVANIIDIRGVRLIANRLSKADIFQHL